MNLIEAIKSGKPFRRKMADPAMKNLNPWRGPFVRGEGYTEVRMELSDLTAEDYEIQEPTVTITRAQFWDAASKATGGNVEWCYGLFGMIKYTGASKDIPTAFQRLAIHLGLEPDTMYVKIRSGVEL
jgi:hypothetical protein